MKKVLISLAIAMIAFSVCAQDVPGTVNFPTSLDSPVSLFEVTNNAVTSLSAPMGATDVTVSVLATAAFPATGVLSVDGEIMYYTGKTSTSFTGLIRGRQGTTATTHASGQPIQQRYTAGHHEVVRDAVIRVETKVGFDGGNGDATPFTGDFLVGDTTAGSSTWRTLIAADIPALDAAKITTGTFDVLRIPSLPESQITNLTTDLAAKAPLASPALTGVPTAPTASVGTNTTQIATTAFVLANGPTASGVPVSPAVNGQTNVQSSLTDLDSRVSTNTSNISAVQANYVTTNTTQTITGAKTFSNTSGLTVSAPNGSGNSGLVNILSYASGSAAVKFGYSVTPAYHWSLGESLNSIGGQGLLVVKDLVGNNSIVYVDPANSGSVGFGNSPSNWGGLSYGPLWDFHDATPVHSSLPALQVRGWLNLGDENRRYAAITSISDSAGGALIFYTNRSSLNNAVTESMRIDGSGNVGIGVTPKRKLHILGPDGAVASFPSIANQNALIVENNGPSNSMSFVSGATTIDQVGFVETGATVADGYVRYDHSTDTISLATAATSRLSIDNVGQITSTAGYSSGGIVRATGTNVPATGVGAELYYTVSGLAGLNGYNRGTGVYVPVYISGSTVTLTRNGPGGACDLCTDSSGVVTTGSALKVGTKITNYNGITTQGNGVGAIDFANPTVTGFSSSIGNTNLRTSGASPEHHQVCWNVVVTRAATTSSSILFTLTYPNGSATRTVTLSSVNGAAPVTTAYTGNALGAELSGCYSYFLAASSTSTFSTTYASSGGTSMQYSILVTDTWLR